MSNTAHMIHCGIYDVNGKFKNWLTAHLCYESVGAEKSAMERYQKNTPSTKKTPVLNGEP